MDFNVTIHIPKMFFKKDFLDIEVEKSLAIRGDNIRLHVNEYHMNDFINKTKAFLSLLTADKMYDISNDKSNVLFTLVYI